MGAVIYDSIPSPQPPNVVSQAFQATQTAEFGNIIDFAGTDRVLSSVTVLMSDWALASDYASLGSSPTWNQDLTFNLYNVGTGGLPGALINSETQTFAIPWRPASDPTCDPNGGDIHWRASDGHCYHGLAFTVTFDFTGTIVPDQIIYGLAFNTETWGYDPTGLPGPYDSLNFGLGDVPPSVGSNPFPNTAYAAQGGTPTFQSISYSDGSAGVSFDTVPEPATCMLLGTGLLCVGLVRRRRSKIR
jgi:hypothetical protein